MSVYLEPLSIKCFVLRGSNSYTKFQYLSRNKVSNWYFNETNVYRLVFLRFTYSSLNESKRLKGKKERGKGRGTEREQKRESLLSYLNVGQ